MHNKYTPLKPQYWQLATRSLAWSKWNLELKSIYKCYRKCTKSRAKRLRPALVHLLYVYVLVSLTRGHKASVLGPLTFHFYCSSWQVTDQPWYTHLYTILDKSSTHCMSYISFCADCNLMVSRKWFTIKPIKKWRFGYRNSVLGSSYHVCCAMLPVMILH